MRTLCSAILLSCCALVMSLSASGQDAPTVGTGPQASGNDCAPTDVTQKEVKWDLIYPGSDASYVGGTVPEMNMSAGKRLLQWASLQPRQFRRNGRIALAPGCLLFAFNARERGKEREKEKEEDSFLKAQKRGDPKVNYEIFGCSEKVKLSNSTGICERADDDEHSKSYVITIPYAKVNVLSRAKYATSDLTSISTAYAAAGGSVLTAISSSLSSASTTDEVLGLGGTAGFLTVYYIVAIARPRMRDNYIAVFVEPPAPKITLSRQSNDVTATTRSRHYFREGQQIEISGVANTDVDQGSISDINRDAKGKVTVTTKAVSSLAVGEQVQIAEVPDPSFNGPFQVESIDKSNNTFTYEQKDKPKKAMSAGGKVQDVWNGTFLIKKVQSPYEFTYWQVGANKGPIETTGTATLAAPVSTNVTVDGNLALSRPADAKPKSADLTATATLTPPPAKSDELFKKSDLVMFRIPNHHDYYNISMTLSGGTGLTFVSETAEKTGK